MRYLLVLFLLLAPLARAAQGDFLGAAVADNGWQLHLYYDGLQTNGTFIYGFGASNNVTGNERCVLTFDSQGFDTNANVVVVPRTNYGTMRVRFPTPNEANPDVTTNAGITLLKLSLAKPITAGDSNILVTVASGLYTDPDAVPSGAATAQEVTNNSTLFYPKAQGNWLQPGNNQWTNSGTMLAFGYQQLADDSPYHTNGQPLACVKFVYRGATSGETVTNSVARMVLHSGAMVHPASRFGVYSNSIAMTAFTQGENIRCDVFFYPQIGTVTEVDHTWSDTYTFPTPRLISQTNVCDKNGTYGGWTAMVGPGGNNTTGRARRAADVYNSDDLYANAGEWFATIAGANDRIAESNNVYSLPTHDDSGGGVIHVNSNNVAYAGSTVTKSGKPWAMVRVVNSAGTNVAIMNDTGTDDLNDRVWIVGNPNGGSMVISNTGAQVPFSSCEQLVFENVVINSTGLGPFQATTMWVIDSLITNMAQGLRPQGNGNHNWLVRGCNLTGFNNAALPFLFVGNYHPANAGSNYTLITDLSGQTSATADGMIWYNNALFGLQANASVLNIGKNRSITNFTHLQAVYEATTNSITGGAASLTYDFGSTVGFHYTNKVSAHITAAGARDFIDYLDSGSVNYHRVWSSYINCFFEEPGVKTDVFGTPSANRVGNWMTVWGSGSSGNLSAQTFAISISFTWEFPGLYSVNYDAGQHPSNPQFLGPQRYDGIMFSRPGNGDYRTHRTAPQNQFSANLKWQLPFDLNGRPRTRQNNAPGAYVMPPEVTLSPSVTTTLSGGTTTITQ